MRVLMLNKSYVPIRLISIESAITKLFTGVVDAISITDGNFENHAWDSWVAKSQRKEWPENQRFIHGINYDVAIPRVIRSLTYYKVPNFVKLSRKGIFIRDNHTCYICGRQLSASSLTLDHMKPSSRGGTHDWLNLVTCCKRCNGDKGDRLLSELKITPLFLPYKPSATQLSIIANKDEQFPEWAYFGVDISLNAFSEQCT
jgi:5-methylcytosine-specific restriction endonuclease McrA